MSRETVISGIDIGSTTIRIVVGQLFDDGRLHIIGATALPADGIAKGLIVAIDDAVSAISQCVEKAERLAGVPIERAYISISGAHVTMQASKGVVAVSKADGEIREDDVERVIEAAEAVATPPNHEILHVIPRSYTVDGQAGIKDPVGMTGVRLEVETQIIQGLSAQIKNITKTVYRTGVDIDALVLAPIAAAEAVLTRRQRELGVALVVFGGPTTGLAIYEDGDVLHTAIIPVGSQHITADLAIGLQTSIDIAERIKVVHGTALPAKVQKKESIEWDDVGGMEDGTIDRKRVAKIIEARLEEMMEFVNKELKAVHRRGLLPAGVVITGGGARLPGIVDVAKQQLKLPASLGVPQGLTTAIEKIHDPAYAVAVGLVLWGRDAGIRKERTMLGKFSSVGAVSGKMKSWLRALLP